MLTKQERQFIIDGLTWSYSKLTSYETCPYLFNQIYLEKSVEERDNAFAQFGSCCHNLLERYYKGELDSWELESKYRQEIVNAVTEPFPSENMAISYYTGGLEYFKEFRDPFQGRKVLEVEEKFKGTIYGQRFTGVIDLVVQDEGIIIIDHKSKKNFSTSKEHLKYLRQLYLYAEHIKQKFGEYPKQMMFNMFRSNQLVVAEFDPEEAKRVEEWATKTIQSVRADDKMEALPNWFFCNRLCGISAYCEHKI